MGEGNIKLSWSEQTAVVTLARPQANAMNMEMLDELTGVFMSLASEDHVRAVVLTGSGWAFSAGLDLKTVPGLDQAGQEALLLVLNRCFYAVYSAPFPVVCAINGHAIAGGMVLALCGDWRIAADTALQVGLSEVRVGIPYPIAAIEVVRAELQANLARRMVLFGDNLSCSQAVEVGLFDEVVSVENLMKSALAKAAKAGVLPRAGFNKIKYQLRRDAMARIEAAIAGEEPLYGNWLNFETREAANEFLDRKGR